jgi:hypothetical protein
MRPARRQSLWLRGAMPSRGMMYLYAISMTCCSVRATSHLSCHKLRIGRDQRGDGGSGLVEPSGLLRRYVVLAPLGIQFTRPSAKSPRGKRLHSYMLGGLAFQLELHSVYLALSRVHWDKSPEYKYFKRRGEHLETPVLPVHELASDLAELCMLQSPVRC